MDRLLSALATPWLPAWGVVTAVHRRLRADLGERWGIRTPPVQPGSVWLHAASLGEVRAAGRLLPCLPAPIVLTADTDTGAEEARAQARQDGRSGVVGGIRPVDHAWTLAPLWAEARPCAVVFVEGTYWPVLAGCARRAGVPVLRVGAKAGPRTRRLASTGLLRTWWRDTTAVWARDESAAAFLRAVQDAPVEVLGDPKALVPPGGPPPVAFPRPWIVGASLRAGDDDRLLEAWSRLAAPRPPVLLAPRHVSQAAAVAGRARARGWSVRLRSALGHRVPDDVDIVVLDALELPRWYEGAAVALIGGTFDPRIGGHAPWEAAAAGVPVVAGPYGQAQGTAFEQVDALRVVDDDREVLAGALRAALARGRGPVLEVGAARERWRAALAPHLSRVAPESSPRPWLAPVARGVAGAMRLRQVAWDQGLRRPHRVEVPVVSVGSINARSPGKTSTVRALVSELRGCGHRVGVALRGYRRPARGRAVGVVSPDEGRASPSGAYVTVGDEGALLAAAGAWVAAAPDRVAAARALVRLGVTVIVLDDGLQHRRLHRDLDLAVVDARYPLARGPLPAGEAREPGPAPARADLVLVHHGSARFTTPGEPVTRVPTPWRTADGVPAVVVGPVAAFCGIGRPADFLATLDLQVAAFRALRDHQRVDRRLADELLEMAEDRPLVCTGKDLVRLPPRLRSRVRWRDIEVSLPPRLLARLPAGPCREDG